MRLPRLLSVPGQPDRRRAIVLLVLAMNTPLFLAMNTPWLRTALGAVPPAWLLLVLQACLVGQVITLAYWFSLSRDTLWFRLTVLLTTVMGYTLGTALTRMIFQLLYFYRQDPVDRPTVLWVDMAQYVAWEFAQRTPLWLALFLLAYAVYLPIRRLRGISLGTAERNGPESVAKRQFQIYEWMIWTVIVASPLVLVRIAASLEMHPESESMFLFGSLLLFGLSTLVVGWPVFRAALAERHAVFWTLAAFAALAGFGWLACEAAFWINIDRLTGKPGFLSRVFTFWPFETFVLTAAGTVCLNAFALRWLGFRIRRGEGAAADTGTAGATAD